MDSATSAEAHIRNAAAVALIDAWLSQHAYWVDSRAVDFALDVRALLYRADEDAVEDLLTAVGANS